MARISTYGIDSKPELGDKVVGTDTAAGANLNTKNYSLQDIIGLFNKTNSLAVADQSVFLFQDDLSDGRSVGTVSFEAGGGVGNSFGSVTKLIFSKNALGGTNISSFLQLFLNREVLIAEVGNINNFGRFKVTSIGDFSLDNTFYEINLTINTFNGVLSKDAHYIFSEFGAAASSPFSLPYKSYVCLLSQSGSNAPVATVLQNNLGVIVSPNPWERVSAGLYNLIAPGFVATFPIGKTVVFLNNGSKVTGFNNIHWIHAGTTKIQIKIDPTADNNLVNASFEVRVYD